MKTLILWLIVLIVSGCASEPRIPPPDWGAAERGEVQEAAGAREIPLLCAIPWDPTREECWTAVVAYEIVAEANAGIAEANKEATLAAEEGYDRAVAGGKLQYELSMFWHDLLEEERKGRELDKWYYRGMIGVILLAFGLGG